MKILLLGKDGQLAWSLARALAPAGEVVALGRAPADGLSGDLADLAGLEQTMRAVDPDVVVNAAAYTAVDQAETDRELAFRVNAEAPELLARAMRARRGWLLHYSTDYVFDGAGDQAFAEDDAAAPLNIYGASKLAGDEAVVRSGVHHLIFRCPWLYGAQGQNFLRSVLALALSRRSLRMVADQIGAPTGTDLVADISVLALRQAQSAPALSGLYHLAAAGAVTRHAYAQFIIDEARRLGWPVLTETLAAISTADYPQAAPRPLNARLDCSRLQSRFRVALPPWQAGVTRVLTEWRRAQQMGAS